MKREVIKYTTNGSGAATVRSTNYTLGELYAVAYLPGSTDTGATVTLTCEGAYSKPLLTKASAGTSNTVFYPRDLVNAVADGAALTGTAGGDRAEPVIDGNLQVVIASGGNAKSGMVIFYYE